MKHARVILLALLLASAASGATIHTGPSSPGDGLGGDADNLMPWTTWTDGTGRSSDTCIIHGMDDSISFPQDTWPTATAYYASTICMYGKITWTVDASGSDPCQVGQWVNGDIWVVEPGAGKGITLVSISPAWDGTRNGSVLNIQPSVNGYHISPVSGYNAAYNIADDSFPQTIPAGSVIVSTVGGAYDHGSYVNTAAILTVVASAPAAGSFRPGWCDETQTVAWNETDLNYEVLQDLAPVDAPTLNKTYAEVVDRDDWNEYLARIFERPNPGDMWNGDPARVALSPVTTCWPYAVDGWGYGTGEVSLALNCAYSDVEKRQLLICLTQRGLDCYSAALAGGGLSGAEGHATPYMFPVLFAATALGDTTMRDYVGTFRGSDEREQYFYVKDDANPTLDDVFAQPYELYTASSTTAYQTGTVTVANGSTTVTLAGGTWAALTTSSHPLFGGWTGSNDTRKTTARSHVYTVASYTDATHLELAEAYEGPNQSGMAYKVGDVYYGHAKSGKLKDYNTARYDFAEMVAEDVGLPEWGSFYGYTDQPTQYGSSDAGMRNAGPFWGFLRDGFNGGTYRWSSPEQHGGMILSLHAMGLTGYYGAVAAPMIDYMDRHWEYTNYIFDTFGRNGRIGGVTIYGMPNELQGDSFRTQFMRSMWAEYRDDYAGTWPVWTAKATNTAPDNGVTALASAPALTWTSVDGLVYDVYVSLTNPPGADDEVAQLVSTGSYDTTSLGLSENVTYYWCVCPNTPDYEYSQMFRPTNTATTGNADADKWKPQIWSFSMSEPVPPNAATTLSPANGATGVATSATITWADGGGALTYDLYFDTDADLVESKDVSVKVVDNQAVTSYDPDPATGTVYYYKVVSRNATGTAETSTTSFRTLLTVSESGDHWTVDFESDDSEYGYFVSSVTAAQYKVSIAASVKFASVAADQCILGRANYVSICHLFWDQSEGKLAYHYGSGNGGETETVLSDAWTPTPGTWYHVVLTHDGNGGNARFYVNGSAIGAPSTTYRTRFNAVTFGVGCYYSDASTRSQYFDGEIANLAVWLDSMATGSVLSADNVTTLYNAGVIEADLCDDIVSPAVDYMWEMEEGTGDTTDPTVGSPVITLVNSPTWAALEQAAADPGVISGPSPANSATGATIVLTLSWTESVAAVSHNVYFGSSHAAVSDATTASVEFKGNQLVGSESYTPGTLSALGTYYWRVDEVDESGNVRKGEILSFTTAAETVEAANPGPDDTATGVSRSVNTKTVTWAAGAGAETYNLYLGTTSGSLAEVATGITATSYRLPGLMAGTTYYWRVDAVSEQGTATGTGWSFTTREQRQGPFFFTTN